MFSFVEYIVVMRLGNQASKCGTSSTAVSKLNCASRLSGTQTTSLLCRPSTSRGSTVYQDCGPPLSRDLGTSPSGDPGTFPCVEVGSRAQPFQHIPAFLSLLDGSPNEALLPGSLAPSSVGAGTVPLSRSPVLTLGGPLLLSRLRKSRSPRLGLAPAAVSRQRHHHPARPPGRYHFRARQRCLLLLETPLSTQKTVG